MPVAMSTVVFAHGIRQLLLLVPALRLAEWSQTSHSWLLTASLGDGWPIPEIAGP